MAGRVVVTIAVLAIALLPTPVGTFLRAVPYRQAEGLIDIARRGLDDQALGLGVLGRDYGFIRFAGERTPEDAVILMTDQLAPESVLERLKGKSQRWVTFFLYPRRILYLHQEEDPRYRDARFLILDGPESVLWIAPEQRPEYVPGQLRLATFDMGVYLRGVENGTISPEHLPPRDPIDPDDVE